MTCRCCQTGTRRWVTIDGVISDQAWMGGDSTKPKILFYDANGTTTTAVYHSASIVFNCYTDGVLTKQVPYTFQYRCYNTQYYSYDTTNPTNPAIYCPSASGTWTNHPFIGFGWMASEVNNICDFIPNNYISVGAATSAQLSYPSPMAYGERGALARRLAAGMFCEDTTLHDMWEAGISYTLYNVTLKGLTAVQPTTQFTGDGISSSGYMVWNTLSSNNSLLQNEDMIPECRWGTNTGERWCANTNTRMKITCSNPQHIQYSRDGVVRGASSLYEKWDTDNPDVLYVKSDVCCQQHCLDFEESQ